MYFGKKEIDKIENKISLNVFFLFLVEKNIESHQLNFVLGINMKNNIIS